MSQSLHEARWSRRSVLQALGSGAVLALGLDGAGKVVNAATPAGAAAPTVFGPWIQIDTTGVVTLVNPEVEYGQGTATANAMLLMEELQADWSMLRIVPSNANRLYTNPGSGRLSTDGSQGMRGRFTQMRTLGAQARMLLLQAAANQWQVPVSECRADKGVITHASSGRAASYGQLVAAAAQLPMPAAVELKPAAQWTLIGKPTKRVDTFLKVTGRAHYATDFSAADLGAPALPGLLHAAFTERPVVWQAKVKSVDASAVRAITGVRHVIDVGYGVAVLADDAWTARKAAELVKVEWDLGPAATLSSDTLAQQFKAALDQPGVTARNDGDVAGMLTRADANVLSAEYTVPFVAHQCMEPANAIAWVHDGIVEFWSNTSAMGNILRCVPKVFRFKEEQIRIHRPEFVGGSFGLRGKVDTELEAMDLSLRVGAPVHLLRRREEELQTVGYRPYQQSRIRAALDDKGQLLAWDQTVVVQAINAHYFDEVANFNVSVAEIFEDMKRESAFYRMPVDFYATAGTPHNQPYQMPNLRVIGVTPELPVQTKHWRSVGYSGNSFITECFLDELCSAARRDPFEFRRSLLAGKTRPLKVLDTLQQKSSWPTFDRGKAGESAARNVRRNVGWGMAWADGFDGSCGLVVQVSVRQKPSAATGKASGNWRLHVDKVVCVFDQGLTVNPNQTEAQVQGGIVDGLSNALYGEITFKNGKVQQSNFHDYRLLSLAHTPVMEIYDAGDSKDKPGSMTELITPVLVPALVNAVYAATGLRIRELPLAKHGIELV